MRFPIAGTIMVVISGITLMLYIIFNYAYTDLRNAMWSSGNDTLSGRHLSEFGEMMQQIPEAMGLAFVIFFGISILVFIVDALRDPRDMW
jgi:hypothetical protein